MPKQVDKKKIVTDGISVILEKINTVLKGKNLDVIKPVLSRIDRTGHLPTWFNLLAKEGCLPNLDGKTVGSVIEKLLVCILEIYVFNSKIKLSINPAKGVDIPELELGIKSPSTNFCTSEPYFSAYERLLGNEYDALILLTNYQESKKIRPFLLQINDIKYLSGSEIADINLCAIAKGIREKYQQEEAFLKKAVRFLAYINQSDWEANCILKMMLCTLLQGNDVKDLLKNFSRDFAKKNAIAEKKGAPTIPSDSLKRLLEIPRISPIAQGIITAADNWVILTQRDNGRYPNENEWCRFMRSPLNGKIGMSFALQWRYNFGPLFRAEA